MTSMDVEDVKVEIKVEPEEEVPVDLDWAGMEVDSKEREDPLFQEDVEVVKKRNVTKRKKATKGKRKQIEKVQPTAKKNDTGDPAKPKRKRKPKPPRQKEVLTEEEIQARKEERKKFQAIQRQIREELLPEEEQRERSIKLYFRRQAYYATLTKEQMEQRIQRKKEWNRERIKAMSKEQVEEKNRKKRLQLQSLTGEARKKYLEMQKRGTQAYFQRWKERDPEGFKEYFRKKNAKHYHKLIECQRKRVANETPEEREKRLLRYRINAQKRKWRKRMEEEGIWSKEEIEIKLKHVEEEERRKPRPPVTSVYTPRPQARKPKSRKETTYLEKYGAFDPNKQQEPCKPRGWVKKRTEFGPGWKPKLNNWKAKRQPALLPPSTQVTSVQVADQEAHSGEKLEKNRATKSRKIGQLKVEVLQGSPVKPGTSKVVTKSRKETTVAPPSHLRKHSPVQDVDEDVNYDSSLDDNDPNYSPPPPEWDDSSENEETEPFEPEQVNVSDKQLPLPIPTPLTPPVHQKTPAPSTQPIDPPSTSLWLPAPKDCGPTICDECGSTFANESGLKDHKNRRHNSLGSDLICPECNVQFPSPQAFWNHYSVYHASSALPPELQVSISDSQVSRVTKAFQTRLKKQMNILEPNDCPECGKHFAQKCTLDDHIRRYHEGKGHFCPQCGASLQSATKLWRHQVDRHGMKDLPPPPGSVVCEYCSEIVMRGYVQHVRKHHPEHAHNIRHAYEQVPDPKTGKMKLKCPHCPSTFADEYKVKDHIKALHIEHFDGVKHTCPECGRQFPTKIRLVRHYNSHAFDKLLAKLEAKKMIKRYGQQPGAGALCLLCETDLPSVKISVKAHFASAHHEILKECELTKEAVFNCTVCTEQFRSSALLNKHLKEEHGHKTDEFPCQYCGEVKRSKHSLNAHEKYHREKMKEETNGICWICKKNFGADPSQLVKHLQESHPNQFWACGCCGRILMSESEHLKHEPACVKSAKEEDSSMAAIEELVKNKLKDLKVLCTEEGCTSTIGWKMSRMMEHLRNTHGIKQEPTMRCDECRKLCLNRMYWVAHNHLVHEIPIEDLVELKEKKQRKRKRDNVNTSSNENDKANFRRGNKRRRFPKRNWDDEESDYETRMGISHLPVKTDIENKKRLVIKLERLTDEQINRYKPSCVVIKVEV